MDAQQGRQLNKTAAALKQIHGQLAACEAATEQKDGQLRVIAAVTQQQDGLLAAKNAQLVADGAVTKQMAAKTAELKACLQQKLTETTTAAASTVKLPLRSQ